MFRKVSILAATAAFAASAVPVSSQDAEPPRTTYRIEFMNFEPGGANQWDEVMEKYVAPSRKELGMPPVAIHWLMAGDWEIMTVTEMPGGMAMLDKHQVSQFAALDKKIMSKFPSEDEAKAMREKIDESIEGRMVTYSHTHP